MKPSEWKPAEETNDTRKLKRTETTESTTASVETGVRLKRQSTTASETEKETTATTETATTEETPTVEQ